MFVSISRMCGELEFMFYLALLSNSMRACLGVTMFGGARGALYLFGCAMLSRDQ